MLFFLFVRRFFLLNMSAILWKAKKERKLTVLSLERTKNYIDEMKQYKAAMNRLNRCRKGIQEDQTLSRTP